MVNRIEAYSQRQTQQLLDLCARLQLWRAAFFFAAAYSAGATALLFLLTRG